MELADLRAAWAATDANEAALHLNRAAVHAIVMRPARSALQRIAAALAFELACTFAAAVLLGSSLAMRVRLPEIFFATVALDAYAIAIVAALVRNLVDLRRIDVSAPIIAIQERFERFRLTRSRTIRAILLTAPLAWVPFAVVVLAAFGIDAGTTFGTAYVVSNVVFGCAVLLVGVAVATRPPVRLSESRLGRSLSRTLSGTSVREAETALRDVADFAAM
jgi:hypothetical protein